MTIAQNSLPAVASNGTPRRHTDGAEAREEAHRRHRRHCRRPIRLAQHAILERIMQVGVASAPDFDLPPASSGSRTYIGTAFLELRHAGLIRTAGPPFTTAAGGRHSHFLHRWRLAVDAVQVAAWLEAHPVPDVDADEFVEP